MTRRVGLVVHFAQLGLCKIPNDEQMHIYMISSERPMTAESFIYSDSDCSIVGVILRVGFRAWLVDPSASRHVALERDATFLLL